jgi:hypothetical protein
MGLSFSFTLPMAWFFAPGSQCRGNRRQNRDRLGKSARESFTIHNKREGITSCELQYRVEWRETKKKNPICHYLSSLPDGRFSCTLG